MSIDASTASTAASAKPDFGTEHYLVSCLIKGPDAVWTSVKAGIRTEHFIDPLCRRIWAMLSEGSFECAANDTLAIAEELTRGRPFAETEQMDDRIIAIGALIETSVRTRDFAQRLIEERRAQKITEALRQALASIETGTPATDAVSALGECLSEAETIADSALPPSAAEIAENVRQRITTPDETGAGPLIYLGLGEIDPQLTPIRSHEMVVLAGPTSGGKSSLAAHIARVNAIRGVPCLYFTLETSADEVVEQMAAQQSLIPAGLEYTPGVASCERYMRGVSKIGGLPLFIGHRNLMLHQIQQITLAMHRAQKLGLVVIDYLQLIEIGKRDRPESREQYVATITRKLKQLTLQLNVPVLALCQLNRDPEKQNRRPKLGDLRESGAIEQDADRVLMLYRPEKTFANGSDQSLSASPPPETLDMELIQRKCRKGPRDVFSRIQFRPQTTSFTPYRHYPASGDSSHDQPAANEPDQPEMGF